MKNWPIKYNNLKFTINLSTTCSKRLGRMTSIQKYFNLNKIDKISSSKIKKILSYFVGFPRSMKKLRWQYIQFKIFFLS